jgi:predicted GNAT family N-acyltransferase
MGLPAMRDFRGQALNMVGNVRIASTKDELHAIYKFRYETFVVRQGKAVASANHKAGLLSEPVDEAAKNFFVSDQDGQIIACSRGAIGRCSEELYGPLHLDKFQRFAKEELYFVSRMISHPQKPSGPALLNIMLAMYKDARDNGTRIGIAHCRPELVKLYSKLGWRPYAAEFTDDIIGKQIPILLVGEDVNWIKSANRFLYELALLYENTAETTTWYQAHFGIS